MKYLVIDKSSLEEVINGRQYQSVEFDEGKILLAFIKGSVKKFPVAEKSVAVSDDAGGFIISIASNQLDEDFFVFDFEEMQGLFRLSDTDLMTTVQKSLRFVKKLWFSLAPAKHERIISDGKAILFPYPIGMQTSLRLSIDRSPDVKRRSRRETGQAYLAYKFGDNVGDGPSEEPRLTNFRKASDGRTQALELAQQYHAALQQEQGGNLTSLHVTQLSDDQRAAIFETGLDNWRRWLTSSQLGFVDASLTAPHRIEGPAGTGKTLCLVLKAIRLLSENDNTGKSHRALFVTHSQSTKTAIENLFSMNGGQGYLTELSPSASVIQRGISIITLHELCAILLHQEISLSELVDRDAYESKLTQKLYTTEAVERTIKNELASHIPFLSPEFSSFLKDSDNWAIAEMLQHEISVQIKGRAEQDLTKYKKLPALNFGMPVHNDGDRAFVFLMYEAYQRELEAAAQFDTDDVVLSAISQLGTPIWRRRRVREGYDSLFIDETHLFNLNELSIFHKLTRSEEILPIAYSVDRSQALGDRGWTSEAFEDVFNPTNASGGLNTADVRSIFRCSPEITDLAFSVTSSGATLFTNFHNPLIGAISAFSADEERKCQKPLYVDYASDEAMLYDAFSLVEGMARQMLCSRADIAIVVFGDDLFHQIQLLATSERKSFELICSRGDLGAVQKAKHGNKFILSAPEFVGGLEFAGVILVGVDGGRVPRSSSGTGESQCFLNYAAHQRLYVAITRAKYQIVIQGNRARGLSSTLQSAKFNELLDYRLVP
ncbi:MAG: UvrD-helicase domain-containing protein [Pseudomonadota bacterium]